jgi:hypothetical protein
MKKLNTSRIFTAMLFMALLLGSATMSAQKSQLDVSVLKDCCMMKDGKMMQLKDGQLTKIKKAVVLENGTKVKRNGVCVMPDRTRVRMKEGNCIDKAGKIGDCAADKPKTAMNG